MVQAKSENNQIKVGVQGTPSTTNISVTATNSTNPVQAANDKTQMYEQRALTHANNAKLYADQAQESAEQAQESNEAVTQKLEEVKILTNNALITINKDKNEAVAIISTLTEETVNMAIEQANIATENAEITIVQAANALASEKNAKTSETNALTYSNSANTSATTAKEQANISTEKAQESADYSELSKQWAISDTLVDNTDYSSKHYATVAKEEADKAELYRGQASQSAEDAQRDANIASVSASMASNHLEAATEQANISIANAEISTTQAGNALKSAENAALSEANAKESENKAKASEQNAKSSEQRCEEIYSRLGVVIKLKGRVDALEDLPTTNVVNGDAYLVGIEGLDSYPEYYWYEDHWEYMGSTDIKLEWGGITGTLSNQTDLQAVLDGKADKSDIVTYTAGENITIENGVISGTVDLTGYIKNKENMSSAISIGNTTSTVQSTTIGCSAYSAKNGTAMGHTARAEAENAAAFGKLTTARGANSAALGYKATVTASDSIQLGQGTNSTANSLQAGNYPLLDLSTGKIPEERLSTNIAKLTDIPDVSNLATKDDIPDTSNLATKDEIPDLTDYVKNTDYATSSNHGIIKVDLATGISTDSTGKAYISKATDSLVTAKTNNYRPLVPSNIDLVVKTGMTTNTIGLTDEEKTNAKEWLGISGSGGHDLFDIVQKDHILTYEETEGYELLGSYVYKTAVAGSRYGYPDFYNKVVEEYNNATETKTVKHYQSTNANIVGNLADSKGVISGFTADNYAQIPMALTGLGEEWEYYTKINLSNNTVISPIIATSVNYDGFQLQVNASGVLQFYLSTNGTSWNIANGLTGTTVLETSKDYWVLITAYKIANIYHYDVMLSTDGKSYKNEISSSIVGDTVFEPTTLYNIGKNHSSNIFNGSIDLKETYLSIGGAVSWEACNLLKVDYKQHSNGHKFFDIADKDAVDAFYNATGTAWFYGVDTVNERILLPRNDYYFKNGSTDEIGKNIEAGLPNIEGEIVNSVSKSSSKPIYSGALQGKYVSSSWIGAAQQSGYSTTALYLDASLSNSIYGNSDTVQPASVSVLAYMVVGNVKTTEGYSEVVAQGKEILEQVNEGIANGIETRANLDLSNVTQASGLRRLIEVSDSSLMPSWYKVFEETNPTTGEVKKWCEQGGIYTSSATSHEILLLKQMPSSEYLLFVQGRGNTNDTGGVAEDRNWITGASPYTNGQSATGFRISSTTGAICFSWEAKGYIN